jgi:hypothetical protein
MSSDATAVTLKGSCLCKWIKFTISIPQGSQRLLTSSGKIAATNCHCAICRNSMGSLFGTWAHIPAECFTVSDLAMNLGTYRSSENITRTFCRVCGTSLFCAEDGWKVIPEDKSVSNQLYNREIKGKEGRVVDVAVGAIDDADVRKHVEIVEHIFMESALLRRQDSSLPKYQGSRLC